MIHRLVVDSVAILDHLWRDQDLVVDHHPDRRLQLRAGRPLALVIAAEQLDAFGRLRREHRLRAARPHQHHPSDLRRAHERDCRLARQRA